MNLKDKIVVITGGTKGLGKALAKAFVAQGSKVIISARVKKELQKISKDLGTDFFVADITKEKQLISLCKFTVKKYGKVDIWVNNAGIRIPDPSIEKMNLKNTRKMLEVNLFGTINGSRVALHAMKRKNKGIILNIISMSSQVGRSLSTGYAISKWATRGFTESLRVSLKDKKILVLAVHPDGIKTEIFGKQLPKGFDHFMTPEFVAKKIINNLLQEKPKEELIINNLTH